MRRVRDDMGTGRWHKTGGFGISPAQPDRRAGWRSWSSHLVTLSPCHLVTLSALSVLLLPAVAAAAEGGFPRGPGFYFNPFKILAVVLVYVAWMRIVWWVDQDAAEFKDMPVQT